MADDHKKFVGQRWYVTVTDAQSGNARPFISGQITAERAGGFSRYLEEQRNLGLDVTVAPYSHETRVAPGTVDYSAPPITQESQVTESAGASGRVADPGHLAELASRHKMAEVLRNTSQKPLPLISDDPRALRPANIMAGAMAGGYLGLGAGPLGGIAGSILGAGFASAGDELLNWAREKSGLPFDPDHAGGGSPVEIETAFGDFVFNLGPTQRALREATFEAAGQGAVARLGPASQALWQRLAGVGDDGRDLMRAARELANEDVQSIGFGVERATDRQSIRTVRNMFAKFPWIGKWWRKNDEVISGNLAKIYRGFVDDFGTDETLHSLGTRVLRFSEKQYKDLRAQAGQTVDSGIGIAESNNSTAVTDNLRRMASEILERGKNGHLGYMPKGWKPGDPYKTMSLGDYQRVMDRAEELARVQPEASLRQLDNFKRTINEELSRLKKENPGAQFKEFTELKLAINKDIEDLGGMAGGRWIPDKAALEEYHRGKDMWRKVAILHETRTAQKFDLVRRGIFKPGPTQDGEHEAQQLFEDVFNASNHKALNDLRALVGQKNYDSMVAAHFDTVFQNAVDNVKVSRNLYESLAAAPGQKKGGYLAFNVKKLRQQFGLEPQVGKSMEPRKRALMHMLKGDKEKYKQLENFLDALEAAQSMGVVDVGQFMGRRAAIGGLTAVTRGATGAFATGPAGAKKTGGKVANAMKAIATIFVLRQVGRLITSPEGLKLATEVIAPASKTSVSRAGAAGRLLEGQGLDEIWKRKAGAAERFLRLMTTPEWAQFPELSGEGLDPLRRPGPPLTLLPGQGSGAPMRNMQPNPNAYRTGGGSQNPQGGGNAQIR